MEEKIILNVVIFYDNKVELINYANKLKKQKKSEKVILAIVANKIGDTTLEELEKELKNIQINFYIFNPKENLGYMNGLIYGYKNFVEKFNIQPNLIVMSNTDVSYQTNDFFSSLADKEYPDNIWCIAPSVYSTLTDSYSNPHYKERFKVQQLNRRIFIFNKPRIFYYYMKLANIKAKFSKKKKDGSSLVYSVHGCYFILTNEFANVLSEKKYGALMYSEEFYIAEIVRKNNKKCYYDSTLDIIHSESSVTGKLNYKKRSKYFVNSLKLIKAEFF